MLQYLVSNISDNKLPVLPNLLFQVIFCILKAYLFAIFTCPIVSQEKIILKQYYISDIVIF